MGEDEKGGKKYEKDYSSNKIWVNCLINESENIGEYSDSNGV